MDTTVTLTHAQLVALFTEWDKRATDGDWKPAYGSEFAPGKADTVFQIAGELFPDSVKG